MGTARAEFTVDDERQLALLDRILTRNRVRTGSLDWNPRSRKASTVIEFDDYREAARALDAVAEWNSAFPLPHPYSREAGIRYRTEPGERFADARAVIARGHDDCDSLSAYLAGYLRRCGYGARVSVDANGAGGAHATVIAFGRRLDPSLELGMPGGSIR